MAMRGAQTPPGEPLTALGQRDEPGLANTKVDPPACGAPPPSERQSSASTDELAVVEPRQRAAKAAEHGRQQADAQPTPMDTTGDGVQGTANAGAAADPASARPAVAAARAVRPLDEPLRVTIDSKERLRWSPQLHQRFCQAVADLGGSPFAKPKDIVTKMNVPGLTLAHVKSHLQKYRQQEGVTFVPHSTRNPPSAGRRHQHVPPQQAQQLTPQAQQATPSAQQASRPASVANSSDSDGAPSAKRARAAASTAVSGGEPPIALWSEPAPVPTVVVAPVPAPAALPAAASAAPLAAAPAEPFQNYLQALTASTALPPPMPKPEPVLAPPAAPPLPVAPPAVAPAAVAPLPVPPPMVAPLPLPVPVAAAPEAEDQAGALDKLHALAELACAQHEELSAERSALQEQAVGLAPVEEQLASVPQQPGWPSAGAEVHARLDALVRQQAALRAAVQQHLQRGMALQDELRGFQHAAQELVAHPLLAQAPLHMAQPATPPLGMVAAATAALRAAAEQHGADPNLASQLLAVMTAAAAAGGGSLAPQVAPPIAPAAAAGLAQLQQLYQNAAMLAARQAV